MRGADPSWISRIPDTPIYRTANAIDSIPTGMSHHPEEFRHVVKTGDYRTLVTATADLR